MSCKPTNLISATVVETVYFGSHTLCLLEAGGHRLTFPCHSEMPSVRKGDVLQLTFEPEDALILEGSTPPQPSPT